MGTKNTWRKTMAGAATALLLGLAGSVGGVPVGAPGQLDTSFGTGGQVEFDFTGECTSPQPGVSAVTQPMLNAAGQITLAGGTGTNCGASTISIQGGAFRLSDSGALDSGFSSNGRALYSNVGGSGTRPLTAAVLQADGKLVAGSIENGDITVYRFNADGSVDTGFGTNGRTLVTRAFLGITSPDAPSQIAMQADGRILMAGRADNGGQVHFYYLLRFNADGTLDTTFDGDGFFISNDPVVGTDGNQATRRVTGVALALQGDRVVVGYLMVGFNAALNQEIQNYAFARHLVSGSRDTAFGSSGAFTFARDVGVNPAHIDLAIQSDGRVVFTADALALGRLTADGALDSSFGGGDGQVFRNNNSRGVNLREMTSLGDVSQTQFRHVAVQRDGRIVLSGNRLSGGGVNINGRIGVARFLADGTPDLSFGDDVVQIADTTAPFTTVEFNQLAVDFYTNSAIPTAGLAIDAQGRVVVAGVDFNQAGTHVLGKVARLLGATGVDPDIRPDAFTLADQFDVPVSSQRTSLPITVSGIADQGFALIRVDGGTYSINGGTFTNAMEKVRNGDVITVRHVSALTAATRTTTRLRLSAGEDEVAENFISITAGGVCTGSVIPATLDTAFDGDGIRARNIGTDDGHDVSLLLTADDRPFLSTGTRSTPPGQAAAARFTTNGADDSDFSGDGLLPLAQVGPFTTGQPFQGIARQPDGKIIVGGAFADNTVTVGLVRINPDGSLDTSFSGDGVASFDNAVNVSSASGAVAVQADGKILVAGRSRTSPVSTFIARFNRDGTLDDGSPSDSTPGEGWSVGDGDGRDGVFVDGSAVLSSLSFDTLELRVQGSRVILLGDTGGTLLFFGHSANGARDNSFGSNGIAQVVQPVDASSCSRSDFLVRPDGKLLFTSGCATVGQLNVNGTLDTSFSGDGLVFRTFRAGSPSRRELTTDLASGTFNARRIALQPDGKIVVAGVDGLQMRLARFFPDGLPDTGFGDDRIEISFGSGFRNNVGLAVDSLGRVIFADTEATGTPVNLLVGSLCGGASVDTRVDDFAFVDQTNVPRSTVRTSAPITIAGLRATVPAILRVEGGSYSIGCGADNTYTDAMEKVVNGQTICLRHTSAATDNTAVNTTLRVSAGPDEFSDVFTSTTTGARGTIQFDPTTLSVSEGAGTVMLTVTRTGGTAGQIFATVNFRDGSATEGVDFTSDHAHFFFGNGEGGSKTVPVTILEDALDEPNETATFTLQEVEGMNCGIDELGPVVSTATLTILDNDDPARGTVQFGSASVSASEGAGAALLTVTRTGGSFGAITATVMLSAGSATAADFDTTTRSVVFADGDAAAKTVSIPITNDTLVESSESFSAALASNVASTLGAPALATVTITDDDVAPPPPPPPAPAPAPAPAPQVQASASSGGALGFWLLPVLGFGLLARRRATLLAALALLSLGAQAAEPQWAVRAVAGPTWPVSAASNIQQAVNAQGHQVRAGVDEDRLGYGLEVEYAYSPRYSLVAAYARLGEASATASGSTASEAALVRDLANALPRLGDLVSLSATTQVPLHAGIAFEPSIGVFVLQGERRAQTANARVVDEHTLAGVLLGVGFSGPLFTPPLRWVSGLRFHASAEPTAHLVFGLEYRF